MAQMAQSRELAKSAFAIQRASEVLDHGMPAIAAPAQKLACLDQCMFLVMTAIPTETWTDRSSSYFSTFHCRIKGINMLLSPRAARISLSGCHV